MVIMINVYTLNRIGIAVVALIAVFVMAACGQSSDERIPAPASDPPIACSSVEGPRASRDAESAIASAKAAWASTYEKNPSSSVYSPANIARFEPYTAILKEGVWQVKGTVPPGYRGYVPITSVCKNDEAVSTSWIEIGKPEQSEQ
jgi:hypothetical protein